MTSNDTDRKAQPDHDEPSDEVVVQTAAEAAEGVVLSHYRQSELRDFDVSVSFEDGVLAVDVYVNPPTDAEDDAEDDPGDDAGDDAEAVAEAAVAAATEAVDELFEE